MKIRFAAAIAAAVVVSAGLTALLTAGPLDPPAGPVTASYKTLSEVEPRTPLSPATTPGDADSVYRITQPGSYYLTGALRVASDKSGVEIAAANVTIDLMGFSIDAISGALNGVATDGVRNAVTIRNGSINGFGQAGINLTLGGVPSGAVIEGVTVSQCAIAGINAGDRALIRDCAAYGAAVVGIQMGVAGRVEHCTVSSNFGAGISVDAGTVADCVVIANQLGVKVTSGGSVERTVFNNNQIGLAASNVTVAGCTLRGNNVGMTVSNARVSDCLASLSTDKGIVADSSRVERCRLANNNVGLNVVAFCTIADNSLNANTTGMAIDGGVNHIERNNLTGNTLGVQAIPAGNIFIRNTAANTINWSLAAGNNGLFVNAVDAPSVTGSTGGLPIGSTDPSANFSY